MERRGADQKFSNRPVKLSITHIFGSFGNGAMSRIASKFKQGMTQMSSDFSWVTVPVKDLKPVSTVATEQKQMPIQRV